MIMNILNRLTIISVGKRYTDRGNILKEGREVTEEIFLIKFVIFLVTLCENE